MAMIRVPSYVQVKAPGHGGPFGFSGFSLGDMCTDPVTEDVYDCGTIIQPVSIDPGITPTTPITLPSSTVGSGGYTTISTASGDYQLINGVLYDPNGHVVSTGVTLPATQSAGMTAAQTAAALSNLANSAIN